MSQGAREARRMLALDVRGLIFVERKFDAEIYLRTGAIAVYREHPLPDTPEMREALKRAIEERDRLQRGK